jgi:hypothetical protein
MGVQIMTDFRTSRRSLLASVPAAALAAGGIANTLAIARAELPGVDPIFAVIAEHRAANVAVASAFGREDREDDEDEITRGAQNRASNAEVALFTTAPTTVAGAAALLAYLGADAPDDPDETIWAWAGGARGSWGDTVRAFPLYLAAALHGMIDQQTKVVQPTEPDPILAVIKRHRKAWEAFEDRCSDLDHEGTPEARAEWKRLHKPVKDAECELGEAKCSTLQGAIHLLRYVDSLDAEGQPWHRCFNRSFADALAKIEGARS